MNKPVREIEILLSQELVHPPASLRNDIESTITRSLHEKSRRDDIRWLAFSAGVLALSISLSFVLFSIANRSAKDLLNNTLTVSEDGHRIARILHSRKN